MAGWTQRDLDRVGDADQVQIATTRADGTLSPYVTIWVVRAGDDLYVRSANGPGGRWFRRAVAAGKGRVCLAGTELDVEFREPPKTVTRGLSDLYRSKYQRYGKHFVELMVAQPAASATLQLTPANTA